MKLKKSTELTNQGQPESANGLAGREVRPDPGISKAGPALGALAAGGAFPRLSGCQIALGAAAFAS